MVYCRNKANAHQENRTIKKNLVTCLKISTKIRNNVIRTIGIYNITWKRPIFFIYLSSRNMSKSSQKVNNVGQQLLLLTVVGGVLFTVVSAGMGDGGSRCADSSCTPAPGGAQCQPNYQGQACCPTWQCSNGQTAYGETKSSSSGSSFSFSSGSMSGGMAAPGGAGFPPMGGGGAPGGNPLAGLMGGMGNLFGGLFG